MAAKVAHILRDYDRYLAEQAAEGVKFDPKAFATRHIAGRAALTHLEQLLALGGEEVPPPTDAAEFLLRARAALARLREKEAESHATDGAEQPAGDDG